MVRLIEALIEYPQIPIFGRLEGLEDENNDEDDPATWEVDPIDAPVLLESEVSVFFILKAIQVLPDGKTNDCYIDLTLPERVTDRVYFLHNRSLEVVPLYELEFVCAVPIDCPGDYELFYSRTAPEIGIEVLRQGLQQARNKSFIAQDLGYILRDEGRLQEAAEAFQTSADQGEPNTLIYGELSACYKAIGNEELARKYDSMDRRANGR